MAETLFDREQFKARLRARGVDVTDADVDKFIAQQQYNQPKASYGTPVAGQELRKTRPTPDVGLSPFARLYGAPEVAEPLIPEEEKSVFYDVVSNTLWNALDTALLGIPGAVLP